MSVNAHETDKAADEGSPLLQPLVEDRSGSAVRFHVMSRETHATTDTVLAHTDLHCDSYSRTQLCVRTECCRRHWSSLMPLAQPIWFSDHSRSVSNASTDMRSVHA